MKICPNCGTKNSDSDVFCGSCGATLDVSAGTPAPGGWDKAVEARSVPTGGKKSSKRDVFVDQSEEIVSTIGSNYLQNFLTGGKVARGVGILTRKRFYYKGKNFTGSGKDMKTSTEEGVVSIEDITFSKFIYTRVTGLLVWAMIILVVGVFLAILLQDADEELIAEIVAFGAAFLGLIIGYFVKRKTVFVVFFPGGSFGFDVKYYPIADVRDFQRQLHLLKDQIKNA